MILRPSAGNRSGAGSAGAKGLDINLPDEDRSVGFGLDGVDQILRGKLYGSRLGVLKKGDTDKAALVTFDFASESACPLTVRSEIIDHDHCFVAVEKRHRNAGLPSGLEVAGDFIQRWSALGLEESLEMSMRIGGLLLGERRRSGVGGRW